MKARWRSTTPLRSRLPAGTSAIATNGCCLQQVRLLPALMTVSGGIPVTRSQPETGDTP